MISVIIPVYNAEAGLERMLDGLQKQSCRDFEAILVDDGSSDSSAEICRRFQQNDGRFKYFHQQNAGVSAARNAGLNLSRGEFVAFSDADDVIDENYLEALANAVKDADIAVCDVIAETEGRETDRFSAGNSVLDRDEALCELLSRRKINSGPCAKLYRKSLVENIRFPEMKTYEDILFNLEAFSKAEKVKSTCETGYHYIQNSLGAMSTENRNPSCDVVIASRKIMDFFKSEPQLDSMCVYITLSYLLQCAAPQVKKGEKGGLVRETELLFRSSIRQIIACRSFPKKEKLLFILFAFGLAYLDGKLFFI